MKYDGYVVGPILRKLREDRGYSLTQLSEETGLSVSTLIQMEQGGRNLSMKSLYVLMELYKVDANTILGINKREDCKSIDTRLGKMEKERRAYFTASFLFMLEKQGVLHCWNDEKTWIFSKRC